MHPNRRNRREARKGKGKGEGEGEGGGALLALLLRLPQIIKIITNGVCAAMQCLRSFA